MADSRKAPLLFCVSEPSHSSFNPCWRTAGSAVTHLQEAIQHSTSFFPQLDVRYRLIVSTNVQVFVQNLVQHQLPKKSLGIMAWVGCSLAKETTLNLCTSWTWEKEESIAHFYAKLTYHFESSQPFFRKNRPQDWKSLALYERVGSTSGYNQLWSYEQVCADWAAWNTHISLGLP